jgi:catechol 2,3-dioxygenase-like lactoylglutathione lyase family enzyme
LCAGVQTGRRVEGASQVPENRMKRFHVHVSVDNLDESIRFYSTVFATRPTVQHADYAKWMLEDPRVNFAISTHRQPEGVNHLGFQVDTDDELRSMHAQLEAAGAQLIQENEQPCCYARSDKYWVTDPTGIAWETFHTLGSIPVYGDAALVPEKRPCCEPGDEHRSKDGMRCGSR